MGTATGCNHKVNGGTLKLVRSNANGNVYRCTVCGLMTRAGYLMTARMNRERRLEGRC